MFELTIKDKVYQFNFGFGFLIEINKLVKIDVDGVKNQTQNIGLRYKLGLLKNFDMEALVDILFYANKGYEPRVTYKDLAAYIDDEETNIEELYNTVWDFLENTNATKLTVAAWKKDVENEEKKAVTE